MVKPARPQCNIKPVIHRHPLQMSHWSGPHWLFPQVLGGGKCFILFPARRFMPEIPFMLTEGVKKSGYFYFEYFKDVMRAHSTPLTFLHLRYFFSPTFRFLLSHQRANEPFALKQSVVVSYVRSVFKQHNVSPACKSSLQKWGKSILHFLPQCLSQCMMVHFSLLALSLHLPLVVSVPITKSSCFSLNSVRLPQVSDNTPSRVLFLFNPLRPAYDKFLNMCKKKKSKGYSSKLNICVAVSLFLDHHISKTSMHWTPCSI